MSALPSVRPHCYVPASTKSAPGSLMIRRIRGERDTMFSHVMIGTNDLERAKSFYDALLGALGVPPGKVDRHRIFYMTRTGVFSVATPIDSKNANQDNTGTIGFATSSP